MKCRFDILDFVDWDLVSKQSLSLNQIRKYKNRLNWKLLEYNFTRNQQIEFSDYINLSKMPLKKKAFLISIKKWKSQVQPSHSLTSRD
jgi:hypothetical protein